NRDILLREARAEPGRDIWPLMSVCHPAFSGVSTHPTYLYPLPNPLLQPRERAPATTASGLEPTPTLTTTVDAATLQHPSRQALPLLALLTFAWLFLTASLFTRLNRLSLIPRLSLREKLLVVLGFSIVPPLLALLLVCTSLFEFWRIEERTRLRQHLQQRLEHLESGFTEFIAEQQQVILREREQLSTVLFAEPRSIGRSLDRFLQITQVPFAFLIRCDGVEFKQDQFVPGLPLLEDESRERLHEVARIMAIRILSEYLTPEQFEAYRSAGPPSFWKRDRLIIATQMWQAREMQYFLGRDVFTLDPSFSGFRNGVIKVVMIDPPADKLGRAPVGGFLCLLQPYLGMGRTHFSRLFQHPNPELLAYDGYDLQAGVFARSMEFGDTDRRLLERFRWLSDSSQGDQLLRLARAGALNPWSPQDEAEEGIISACRTFHSYPFVAVLTAREQLRPVRAVATTLASAAAFLYFWLLVRFSAALISRSFVSPMRQLGEISVAIGQGDVPQQVWLPGTGDLSDLAADLNLMCKGLREGKLLSRFVSSSAQADIANISSERFEPGGELRQSAILFSKVRDFHELSQQLHGAQVIELLNQYFAAMEPAILQAGGVLDKYVGDAIMAVFHGIDGQPPGIQAVTAARAMRRALSEFNREQKRSGDPEIRSGIGIACGAVISGRIGSRRHRLEFTVIGDVVNTAARIESQRHRVSHSSILLDTVTADLVRHLHPIIELGCIELKGKSRPVDLYELKTEPME
ncbi:MAG TPA: adenylate/guanylate cyclase domain-containing protein, partial [Candidatus Ozemobacteraceae bacterium]|nr:adenylate/guanylate cyclase domain-containing protein [Candidatus Ozemobacteraceae bacterium]